MPPAWPVLGTDSSVFVPGSLLSHAVLSPSEGGRAPGFIVPFGTLSGQARQPPVGLAHPRGASHLAALNNTCGGL